MSQLKKGALLSYLNIFLTNLIGLALTPFIIKSLGDAEYGLYTLIGAFVGYISVMDLGLNNTIIRYVAKYRAQGDKKGEESFLSTTMIIYGAISILVILIGIILYWNLNAIFGNSLTFDEMEKAKVMFVILIFNIAITLPGGAFSAICSGYEHFVYPRILQIVRYLVRSAAVIGLLLLGGDAIGLVILDTIMNISIILSSAYYVFKKLRVRFKIHTFELPLVKEIFSYSIWIFLLTLVYQFQWRGGQVILGIKTDTVTVAIYAIGILLGTYYGAFASAINGVFLPKAMKMVVNNANGKELTDMTIRVGRLTLLVLLSILGGFILFGQQFIHLWVGDTYREAWLIALIIMITSTNILVQSFADSTLMAKKLFKFKGITYIAFIIIGTIIGYFLIDYYGSLGMILGICFSWALSQFFVTIYLKKEMHFEIRYFYSSLFNRLLPIFLGVISVMYFINYLELNNWVGLLFKIFIFLLLYSVFMYQFGMNKFEKTMIIDGLKSIISKSHFLKSYIVLK